MSSFSIAIMIMIIMAIQVSSSSFKAVILIITTIMTPIHMLYNNRTS